MHWSLDLRRLRYFVAIVENGSFSEAARMLNVAQPALTHHIREMERSYGHPLLIRSRRRVTMTPPGEMLFGAAKHAVAMLEHTAAELDAWKKAKSDRDDPLRVGVISSLSSAVVPRLLSSLARELPGTALQISEKSVRECRERIQEGALDMAITLEANARSKDIDLHLEELFFVEARKDESAEYDSPVPIEALAGRRLILPSVGSSVLRPQLEAIAERHKFPLPVALEIDGLGPRKEAVIAGLGATVLPMVSIRSEVDAGLLVACSFQPAVRRRIVLKSRDGMEPATVRLFATVAGEILRDCHR